MILNSSAKLSLLILVLFVNANSTIVNAAPPCRNPDYNAWGTVTGTLSLTSLANGVRVTWPEYPACDQGGIATSGYQLFYQSASSEVELYSGPATTFDFSSGNTESCVKVRAFSGNGGNRQFTSQLEHANCLNQSNQSPSAIISGPSEAVLGTNDSVVLLLDGSESSDPEDGGVATYFWTSDTDAMIDNATASQTSVTFTAPGPYAIKLEVSDSEGLISSTIKSITVLDEISPPSDQDAAEKGQWSAVFDWPLIAIHAVLLPDGNPFTFGTDDVGIQGAQYFYSVWNPSTGVHQTLPNTTGVDFFCSAPVLSAHSGNVLMPGGDAREGEGFNKGIVNTPVFRTNDRSVNFNPQFDMSFARWYPSSIVLSDGSIHVMGGIDLAGNTSVTPEVFDPNSSNPSWRSLFGASIQSLVDTDANSYFYPRQWVIPGWGGQIFGYAQKTMFRLDPTTESGDFEEIGSIPPASWGHYSTAVMYEPGKILQIGGNGSGRFAGKGASIIDLTGTDVASPVPRFTSTQSMYMDIKRKAWLNSTVLPDGSVFVNGGSAAVNKLTGDLVTAELWRPETSQFEKMATSQQARLYHSSSLLLPDATVLVAGGGAPGPQTNLNAEIFSPPYLFTNDGRLKQAAERIDFHDLTSLSYSYGDTVAANYSGPQVTSISLVKTGAVTHSINLEQRRIPITSFSEDSNGLVLIPLPSDSTVATPGYYLLFLIDAAGTPSIAQIIELQ